MLNKINDDVPVKVVRGMTLAEARRKGAIVQVPRRDVVVGDIVLVESGEKVPADGILLESMSLGVDESSFTGESVICHKSVDTENAKSSSAYPVNKLLRGSNVKEGYGVMRVEAVGDATEYGSIYKDAKSSTIPKRRSCASSTNWANSLPAVVSWLVPPLSWGV